MGFAVSREGDVTTQVSPSNTTRPSLELKNLEASVSLNDDTTRASHSIEGFRVEREGDQRTNLEVGSGGQQAIGHLEVSRAPEEQTTLVDGQRAVSFNTEREAGNCWITSAVVNVETRPNNVPAHKHGDVGISGTTEPTSHVIDSFVGVI